MADESLIRKNVSQETGSGTGNSYFIWSAGEKYGERCLGMWNPAMLLCGWGCGLLQDISIQQWIKYIFFQSLHNIRDSHANTGSTVTKTLNQGPNKNSPQSQWSLGSNSPQPELDIYNKSDEPVPLLLEADRQQVSYALCLNWFGGNF